MDLQAINKDIKREFEEEWERTSVEALLKTNKYPRTKEEFDCLEKFLPKNDLILEAGCGLGPKLIHFDNKNYQILGIDYIFSALEQVKKYDPNLFLAQSDLHALPSLNQISVHIFLMVWSNIFHKDHKLPLLKLIGF